MGKALFAQIAVVSSMCETEERVRYLAIQQTDLLAVFSKALGEVKLLREDVANLMEQVELLNKRLNDHTRRDNGAKRQWFQ